MSGKLWEIIPTETQDHWLKLRDPDGWWEAVVKWDGCVDVHRAGNVPFDKDYGTSNTERDRHACDSYLHICDLDETIKRLQALKAEALKHFGEGWPE